ncbi:MAG: primosomal protein N' [Oscillospiraceae bacterium]|nr:primosomal protein N' [Oscillospiraceae bacterium]
MAAVAVHAANFPHDILYSYIIPSELYRDGLEGCRVVVPFGRGNRRQIGMILNVSEEGPDTRQKLKKILSVADAAPVLNEEQLLLTAWLRENTFCTYYDAICALLPAALQLRLKEHYTLSDAAEPVKDLSPNASQLYALLRRARSQKELDTLLDEQDTAEKRKTIRELTEKRILFSVSSTSQRGKGKKLRMIRLCTETEETHSVTVKQQQVLTALEEFGDMEEKELCYICSVGSTVIGTLVRRGVLSRYETDPPEEEEAETAEVLPPLTLSDEQQQVFDRVAPHLETNQPKCFLLHGVTGSGKTSVFEALIARTLELGKSVLMLLPEIGLTPQTQRRFRRRFGNRVAVVHSSLSLTERRRAYERARTGQADIIIGTRSAVFTPVPHLGLIIMDEEGERSYKSEAAPRYDTIQVAKQRCKYHGAVLLPASATPTLESYYNAQKGIYELLEMKQRYGNAPLPAVTTADMNLERMNGNDSEFSECLIEALRENLERGEQSILLLNRRGYHTIIQCASCSLPVYCEHCSVPMTYHKPDNNLHCHYCGAVRQMPQTCPNCGSVHLRRMGFGTQRLEDEIAARFPTARLLRMDADTIRSRHTYEENFEAFRSGKYDIMLGTQMIGKGLDFPNVTLVGVLSVDKALFSGDFRSYERTFSLITQVVGRGGRGSKPGRAILQTFMPDHYVLRLAAKQDYERFAAEEFSIRKALLFPPFCDICVIGISGESLPEVETAAQKLVECMKEELAARQEKLPLRVLGPVPFTYRMIKGKYRFRIIIKCKNNVNFRRFLRDMLQNAGSVREIARVHVYADMNGSIGG